MKILAFQARRFAWKAFSQTLEKGASDLTDTPAEAEAEVKEAVVAFIHFEEKDEEAEERKRVFRHTLKHVKWLANKRGWKTVVLHSFTHLGGRNADPDQARSFLDELTQRLNETGYAARTTPFGWFCEWELSVHGESLAKVWKEI